MGRPQGCYMMRPTRAMVMGLVTFLCVRHAAAGGMPTEPLGSIEPTTLAGTKIVPPQTGVAATPNVSGCVHEFAKMGTWYRDVYRDTSPGYAQPGRILHPDHAEGVESHPPDALEYNGTLATSLGASSPVCMRAPTPDNGRTSCSALFGPGLRFRVFRHVRHVLGQFLREHVEYMIIWQPIRLLLLALLLGHLFVSVSMTVLGAVANRLLHQALSNMRVVMRQ